MPASASAASSAPVATARYFLDKSKPGFVFCNPGASLEPVFIAQISRQVYLKTNPGFCFALEHRNQAGARLGEREIEPRQHENPDPGVERHEVLPARQHVRVVNRLARELAPRLRREEERLVGLER